MTATERLDEWKHRAKRHSVQIIHDDGYGASCWLVHLYHRGGVTTAHGGMRMQNDETADWMTLDEVIIEALEMFERGECESA